MDSLDRASKKTPWVAPQSPDSERFKKRPTYKRVKKPRFQLNIADIHFAKQGPLPDFVQPALALLQEAPPDGQNWIHEIKFDGYRLQARVDDVGVKLLTRKGLDWTARFPTIARALQPLRVGSALLDGELIVDDDNGVSSFSGLQSDLKAKRHNRMVYVAFDLLYCNGFSLMGATQLDRKAALHAIINGLPPTPVVRFSEHLDIGSEELLRIACNMGLEGIVSKRADAPYRSGRGGEWIKAKCHLRQEFVILGYVPSISLSSAIGSLVVGYYDKGELVHAGRVGTGFSNTLAVELKKTLDTIEAAPPKFKTPIATTNRRGVTWVDPKLVAEVEYRGWSSDNLLRQSSFKGIREDKPAREIRRER
ncbi:MAG TPA: non-homologous end-joining DNA ligase [Aestuariivirga sp.]|nr:non-homologous end-joining DNA ligase [Aestuariivirga sp.]